MTRNFFRLVVLLFGLLIGAKALQAQQLPNAYLGKEVRILDGSWSADASILALQSAGGVASGEVVLNLGNDDQWHWLELDVPPTMLAGQWLELATASLDSLVVISACGSEELYRRTAHGAGSRWQAVPEWSQPQSYWNGSNYPSFAMPDAPCDDQFVYIGVKSGKQVVVPIRLARNSTLREWGLTRDLFFSFYLGIMLVMFLYNAVLYFTVEDRSYLLYVLFLLGVAGSQMLLEGYQWLFPFLKPGSWLGLRAVQFIGIFSGCTTILFVNRFLDLKRTARPFYRMFNVLMSGYGVAFIALLVGQLNESYQVINLVASCAVLVIPASLRVHRQGHKSAMFLLVAFSAFMMSVVVFALKEFGFLPHNIWTKYAMPVGSIIEVVLLSIALADRINQLKKESAHAREEQLRVSRLNEQITREQNEVLEDRVRSRTEELEERNDRLQATLQELKLAQDQLVQSEKLASIGQLTAGIAHELNNPINFVSSSAQSLRRDFEDVQNVMKRLKTLPDSDGETLAALQQLKASLVDLDMEFTMEEIEELLNGIEDGAARTSEIVKGLRIFSRMDGDALTEANLNELLESTLVILRSTLDEVELTVDLASSVNNIQCQPGKLNQVFMNLITNAAQAAKMKDQPVADRRVIVRTRVVTDQGKEWVQVLVEDNGVGMTEETQAQIFDPFFTTKEVGEGTGLGLSIVKGILDDHQAVLEIDSQPGHGSTFLITFPS